MKLNSSAFYNLDKNDTLTLIYEHLKICHFRKTRPVQSNSRSNTAIISGLETHPFQSYARSNTVIISGLETRPVLLRPLYPN
jgi:hypothetical protein